ncbi:ATP-binding cassette domain-containing protein [Ruminococcus sp. OA3]|uniref:ABC transporter ATP-binding protein n=1 Tax=Ruminococcus sp. OA3 TaxID=2914164 RepID=UPI001F067847|nr:ATP-binding cassette domain-containing protein [Ruminococcus sp. OA3]MCH1984501.1 ATP-binding cassette domain-containing protein [Ruminococcus sp. OA3]
MKLEAVELDKRYQKVHALKKVSFSLEEGIYGLLGPNGSGKSTLMNIVTTNLRPSSGDVLWNGLEINKLGKEYRKILGYVPQQQALYPDFTVMDFMQYVALLREVPADAAKAAIADILREVELEEVSRFKIRMLSGGMKQRLLIAQALVGSPELLIMDEPTVGLDPKQRCQIRTLIELIARGRIVVIATHIVSDLESIADEILLLKEGQLLKAGSPSGLMRETAALAKKPMHSLEEVYLYYFGA